MRESVLHDERGGTRWMSCCEQRCRRQRPGAREKDRFATSEIVEHGGDAVGPLLQGWQCARRDGIGCAGARLVEEDEPAERGHRLAPALKGRQVRKDLAAREPVRDEHDVTRAHL